MHVIRVASCLLIGVALAGCSKNETSSPTHGNTSAVTSGAMHETANYKLTIEPVGTYEKGKSGVVKVVLVTKGDYHINEQYPYKFTCQDPPAQGVTYMKKVVRRADGKFDKTHAELPVAFIPDRAGSVKVGGTLSLSVCTAANCLMDKRPLVLDVTVK